MTCLVHTNIVRQSAVSGMVLRRRWPTVAGYDVLVGGHIREGRGGKIPSVAVPDSADPPVSGRHSVFIALLWVTQPYPHENRRWEEHDAP